MRGLLDPLRPDRAELRTDAHAHGLRRAALGVCALGLDVLAGEHVEAVEGQPLLLVRVLHSGLAEVVEDGGQVVVGGVPASLASGRRLASRVAAVGSIRCGDRLSTVNGPVTRTMPLSS